MTKQLPIINETRGINASVSTSFTLLGRGLAVIQSNKLTTPVKVDNAKLLPALSKLMSALIVMGYINFKENAIAALAAIREKFGDAATWAPRIKTGFEALWNSALKGKNAMGAQGGGDFSDVEIGRAVVHMTAAAGGKFAEPAAPAAAAAAK